MAESIKEQLELIAKKYNRDLSYAEILDEIFECEVFLDERDEEIPEIQIIETDDDYWIIQINNKFYLMETSYNSWDGPHIESYDLKEVIQKEVMVKKWICI